MATRRNLSILIGTIVVCTGIVWAQKTLVQEAQTSNRTQWEYGVWRSFVPGPRGTRLWSWQDANELTQLDNVRQFAMKMGVNKSVVGTVESHALELHLINAISEKGWELLWIRQERDASYASWFRKPK